MTTESHYAFDKALREQKPIKTLVWHLKRIKEFDEEGYLTDSLEIVDATLQAIGCGLYPVELLNVLFENRVRPVVSFIGTSKAVSKQRLALPVIKALIAHGVSADGDLWYPFSAHICEWRFDYSNAWSDRPKSYKGSQLDYLTQKQKEFNQSVVDALQYLKDKGANLNWYNKQEDNSLPKIARANLNVAAYRFLKDNGCTSFDFKIDATQIMDRSNELDCIVFRGNKYFLARATIWPSNLLGRFDFKDSIYKTVKHLISVRHIETNEPILFENLFDGDGFYIRLSDGRIASCNAKVPMNYFDVIPLYQFEPFFPFAGVDDFYFSDTVTEVFNSYWEE